MQGRLIYLMGPSGSGKDSLIDAARQRLLQELNCEVARRAITRSAESVGEAALGLLPAQFEQRRGEGAFALDWQANGLSYGIPVQINEWLAAGRNVLVNGSRAYLAEAQRRYPDLLPLLLTVRSEVLRERLVRRGRENAEQIEARLQRNVRLSAAGLDASPTALMTLDNSQALAATVANLIALLRCAGVSAEQGRT